MTVGVWWIKRDFRLLDNEALAQAIAENSLILPLFIAEPTVRSHADWSQFHDEATKSALFALSKDIQKMGGRLYIFNLEALEVFKLLAMKLPKFTVYSNQEIGLSHTFKRDREVRFFLKNSRINWVETRQTGVFRGLKDRGKRSALWAEFMESDIREKPNRISFLKIDIDSESIGQQHGLSEISAKETLDSFLRSRGEIYSSGISSPNSGFIVGSRLSEHLAWGTISPRVVYQTTKNRLSDEDLSAKWKRSLRAFQSRIHWRDHFIQRLETEPEMEFRALNPSFRDIQYENSQELFEAWINGRTGYALVDACMRCLRETGFLNFRMRAMVVSFACHALHLDWRFLMFPLAKLFKDYEPGIHVSQLQMQAGVVGINTIRVYNPTKQLIDQDPKLLFTKKFIPELRDKTLDDVIEGKGYIPKIVDHLSRSKEMSKLLYEIKRSDAGKQDGKRVLRAHGSRRKQLELF